MPTNCDKRFSYVMRVDRERSIRDGDYAYAITRATLPKCGRRLERGYTVASHFAKVIATRFHKKQQASLAESFREQVAIWKNETAHLSSITKAIAHPSYLRIIGLANESVDHEIERLLLNELESEPDHWFAALTAVTGEDPVKAEDDFDAAVSAWLKWGRDRSII